MRTPSPRAVSVVSIRSGRPVASDAELLAAIARDDLSALGEIYERYHADVHRVLHRVTCGSDDVDDLVHTTFLKLPRIAASFDGRASACAWICGIGVRLALRHRRGLDRLLRRLDVFTRSAPRANLRTPELDAAASEELRVFERALGQLSEKKRAAFVLVELEAIAPDEAARALDVPIATLRTRLFHARAELREAMKRGGAW